MPLADQINRQSFSRTFLQLGGTSPANSGDAFLFYGIDTAFCAVGDITDPMGTFAPINVWNPTTIGRYLTVGLTATPPDLPTSDIVFYEKIGTVPRWLGEQSCYLTAYVGVSNCKDPSNFGNGWNGYVLVMPNGKAETGRISARNTLPSGDAAMEDTLSFKWTAHPYPVGPLAFGELANDTIVTEVLDVVYGSDLACANCGVADDGTKLIYAIARGGLNAYPVLLYSTDYGATFTGVNISAALVNDVPCSIERIGQYLLVFSPTGGNGTTLGCYYYGTINQYTGVPSALTKVTGGFVASKNPRDSWAVSEKEIWIVGDGGYVYKLTSIGSAPIVSDAGGATTNNLKRVMVQGQTVVGVGASQMVIVSQNRGTSWAQAPALPGAADLVGVDVRDGFKWQVVGTGGLAWYTINAGNSWTQMTLPSTFITGGGAIVAAHDIAYVTDEVGYILGDCLNPSDPYATNTLGVLCVTFNGGANWYGTMNSSRVVNWPSFYQANRLAVPRASVARVGANNVLIAGMFSASDGVMIKGSAALF